MHITSDIRYVGVNDHKLDLFEGQYIVPNGMAYNSYLIMDEKIAVMDSVDAGFTGEWLANLRAELGERPVDYLIVQHMEPDHSGSLSAFMAAYPQAVVVASAKAFSMMKAFFGEEYEDRRRIVKESDKLALGRHTLSFVAAPMVHWPEVIMTYDETDKVFFSADAFGKFGALDVEEEWACEARRYYFGIVSKYGTQVQALLKKAQKLDISIICPLHGPVLSENLGEYLHLYDVWSGYGAESEGIAIACASIYGHTMKAAALLADELKKRGCKKVSLIDLARCDMAEAVEDAFRYDRLVLASATYNGDVFPFMRTFIDHLTERNYQNRTVGLMENGSWAPNAAKVMRTMLDKQKNLTFTETTVKITSALSDDSRTQICAMADELMK
ncbi:MAG: FprA family A-type flavoprotein [Clostridiales bacterium]|nr:FprA family A-type flavoprotein [Clostridiales bacterium]